MYNKSDILLKLHFFKVYQDAYHLQKQGSLNVIVFKTYF